MLLDSLPQKKDPCFVCDQEAKGKIQTLERKTDEKKTA